MSRLYDEGATDYRIRYAIANILRDRVVNEGAFRVCFQLEDEVLIVRTILRRALKNVKLRTALEHSHLVDITHWLSRFPDISEAYYGNGTLEVLRDKRADTASGSKTKIWRMRKT